MWIFVPECSSGVQFATNARKWDFEALFRHWCPAAEPTKEAIRLQTDEGTRQIPSVRQRRCTGPDKVTEGNNRVRDETGQASTHALTLIVVLVVLVIAVVLLQRTASSAEAIDKKAMTIAQTGRGINDNTDSILQLTKTNQLGSSILTSAKPLAGQLSQVVDLANSINGLALSINTSAGAIDGTAKAINNSAGAINTTAGGINSTASSILSVANSIRNGVDMINKNLDATVSVAQQIKRDTGAIVGSGSSGLTSARHLAGCINKELGGNAGGNC
jgi:methyl-accepting chemotaxis protein